MEVQQKLSPWQQQPDKYLINQIFHSQSTSIYQKKSLKKKRSLQTIPLLVYKNVQQDCFQKKNVKNRRNKKIKVKSKQKQKLVQIHKNKSLGNSYHSTILTPLAGHPNNYISRQQYKAISIEKLKNHLKRIQMYSRQMTEQAYTQNLNNQKKINQNKQQHQKYKKNQLRKMPFIKNNHIKFPIGNQNYQDKDKKNVENMIINLNKQHEFIVPLRKKHRTVFLSQSQFQKLPYPPISSVKRQIIDQNTNFFKKNIKQKNKNSSTHRNSVSFILPKVQVHISIKK